MRSPEERDADLIVIAVGAIITRDSEINPPRWYHCRLCGEIETEPRPGYQFDHLSEYHGVKLAPQQGE